MTATKLRRRERHTNWPLFALASITALTTEALTAGLLWEYEPDHKIGIMYSVLTGCMSLLGLIVSRGAAVLKADPRPEIAAKAFAARIVSLALISPTVIIGGGAMALKMEDRGAIEFGGSAAFAASLANSKDASLDSQVRAEASADLARAIRPTQVRMDDPAYPGALIAFLALALLPLAAVGSGQVFPAETPAQERARLKAASTAKGLATRAANQKAAAKGLKLATNDGRWVANLK